MKSPIFAAILCGLCLKSVGAQTFNQPIDSIRAPLSTSATYGLTVQMEGVNAAGNFVLIGQPGKLGTVDLIKGSTILADIPGPKTATTPPVVVGLRATLTSSGGTGWKPDPIVIHIAAKSGPFNLPLAQTLGCRYDMPASLGSSTLGNLNCAVGVKAASLPAPGPVVVGTVPPPAAPPAAPVAGTPNAIGDSIPPLTQLVDKAGAVWKLNGNRVIKDNVDVSSLPNAYPDIVQLYISDTGTVHARSATRGWECLAGTSWAGSGC